jgi:hypothetical protein
MNEAKENASAYGRAAAMGLVVEPEVMAGLETPPLDAIVVPTARREGDLGEAIELARATGAFLVAVCGHDASARGAAGALARRRLERWLVIDLAGRWAHPLLAMASDRIPEALWGASGLNIALKRNIGLLLARLTGWRSLLFLDDDISGLVPAAVQRATGLLDRHDLVGWRVIEFPDNSVIRHADRLAGGHGEVFISGGALGVSDAAARAFFFPSIYNEDWFFVLPSLARRPAAMIGTVTQQPYDPFQEARAAREEFGDLLAEGLLELLLTTGSLHPPSLGWWEQARIARDMFLDDLIARLGERTPQAARATAAVRAAKTKLHEIPPAACADYVTT